MVSLENSTDHTKNWIDLLVYGTLLPDCELEENIMGCLRRDPMLSEGAKLYNLGADLGAILGKGSVVGAWITVFSESVIWRDRIRAYNFLRSADEHSYLHRPV